MKLKVEEVKKLNNAIEKQQNKDTKRIKSPPPMPSHQLTTVGPIDKIGMVNSTPHMIRGGRKILPSTSPPAPVFV